MSRQRLRRLVTVVTGASSGVGRAIARAFAAEGAKVALIARGKAGLEAAAKEIEDLGSEALVLPLDVSDAKAVDRAAEEVLNVWGRIDVWVNDAMISVFAPVMETEAEEYRRVTEVNYLGFVYGTQAALRAMQPRNRGLIIQIGSALAYRSIPLQSAYCASKAAIRGFTDSLRSELIRERSKVKLTMLHLPAVNTPQFEQVRNKLGGHPQPVPPIYQPEVIAEAAVHAVLHPKREMWIAWSTAEAIIGQRAFPGLLDRYLARRAWEAQTTKKLPSGHPTSHARDDIDGPLPGDRGAHGPFDSRARRSSSRLWLRQHPRLTGALALAAAGFALSRVAARR
jgi:short-subunit dehydrogenase